MTFFNIHILFGAACIYNKKKLTINCKYRFTNKGKTETQPKKQKSLLYPSNPWIFENH